MKRPLIVFAGGFVLGEVLALLSVRVGVVAFAATVIVVLVYTAIPRLDKRKGKPQYLVVPLFFLLGMGFMHAAMRLPELSSSPLPQSAEVEGTIKSMIQKETGWEVLTNHNRIKFRGEDVSIPYLMIYLPLDAVPNSSHKLSIGNRVKVEGTLSRYSTPRNPGEFDSRLYYRSLHIDYRLLKARLIHIDSSYLPYYQGLYRIKEACNIILKQICSAEDAGLFSAAILGDKTGLQDEIRDLYQRNGIAHLLAISGLHISMLGMGLYGLLRKAGLSFLVSGLLGGAFLVSYAIMTGASSSTMRATWMLLVIFLAGFFGRTYDLLSALSLAAVVLLMKSPFLLLQGGFQLSVGAVAAIGGLAPWLAVQLGAERPWQKSILIALSVQLVTYPILLYHFFQYPIYGILLNFLVIPLMAYVIGSGIAGIMLGFVWLSGGVFAIGSGHYILLWYEYACLFFEQHLDHLVLFGKPMWWQLTAYICILGIGFGLIRVQREHKIRACFGLCVLLIAALVILLPVPVRDLEVTFLDVGQGDGVLLRTRKANILIDGGSSSVKKLGEYRLEPYLRSKGIRRIHYAVISHGDLDHISGLVYLLEHCADIQIDYLYLPLFGKEEVYQNLEDLVKRQGGKVLRFSEEEDRLEVGNLTIWCRYEGKDSLDRNEHSQGLQVDYGGFHMLLTGDMSKEGEARLLECDNLEKIQVLKVAHHGSKTSSDDAFLDAIKPIWAVISFEAGNSYGHPHEEVVERLKKRNIKLWQTAECGAITLWTDGKKIKWKRFIQTEVQSYKRLQ